MGKYMWSTSVPLRSLKCIMAQTFPLKFSLYLIFTFFINILNFTYSYSRSSCPRMKLNRSFTILSVVQIIYILFCSIYFLLQFIFSKKSKNICFISIFLYLYCIGSLVPSMFIIMLGSPEKVTLMILYTSILAQFWSRPT